MCLIEGIARLIHVKRVASSLAGFFLRRFSRVASSTKRLETLRTAEEGSGITLVADDVVSLLSWNHEG
jgi:hypothetical protein